MPNSFDQRKITEGRPNVSRIQYQYFLLFHKKPMKHSYTINYLHIDL